MNHNCKNDLRRAFAFFASLAVTMTASAQIFSDTAPTVGGVDGWSLRATTPATNTTFATTTDAVTAGQALSLAYGTTAPTATSSATLIGRSFSETTLTEGQTLRFQFDFHATTVATGQILRFGLFNGTGTGGITASGFTNYDNALGYYSFIRNNSGTANEVREQLSGVPTNGISTPSNFNTLGTKATTYDWGTATAYTVNFDVTYNSLTSGTVTTSIFDMGTATSRYSMTGNWTSNGKNTFDGAFIRLDANANAAMNFDNLSVSVISAVPEPATYAAWMGLGLLTLAVFRRRQA